MMPANCQTGHSMLESKHVSQTANLSDPGLSACDITAATQPMQVLPDLLSLRRAGY